MDPILFWNDVALEANRVSFSNGAGEQGGPTLSSRAMAIVHLAMYDAFAAVSGNPAGLPPYLTTSARRSRRFDDGGGSGGGGIYGFGQIVSDPKIVF